MNKKAQMRILETVAVLIIFFILLVIGSSIYFGIQNSRLSKERIVYENAEALRTLVKLQALPELDCSFASAHTLNCFDKYKLQAFRGLMQNPESKEFYYSLFGNAKITINRFEPFNDAFVIYDNPLPKFRSAVKKILPVLVYDPLSAKYYFGLSEVIKYA